VTLAGRSAVERAVAVIPAGGSGIRMGGRLPKQFRVLAGAPILAHTLRALLASPALDGAVVSVPADRIVATRRALGRHGVRRVLDVVAGGAERQESVWRGLQVVPDGVRWVLVHDAVRPFVTRDLVDRLLSAARQWGAATCGVKVRDSVKRVIGETVESTVDREGLWLVQTPQAFSRDLLWEAHEKALRDGFVGTDDAVLVERLGARVAMVAGLTENVKITTPEDLALARFWLGDRRRARAGAR
jgi:2-C-methyl-D-erythritol 4-phosphate cytidylyltransferase